MWVTKSVDGTVKASYANFGFIPYGQTIMGKMHYDPANKDGCSEYATEEANEIKRSNDLTPFMVAERGDCSFVQKVRNMEAVGVAVGIVVDEYAEDVDSVLMSDDGTGGGIRIPSMLISKTDGKNLLSWFMAATEEEKSQVVIMAEFVLPNEAGNKVEWDLWMTSSSDRAIDFLEDFEVMQEQLGDQVKFTPHYVFWECPGCDSRYIENDCYGGGRYCAVEPSN